MLLHYSASFVPLEQGYCYQFYSCSLYSALLIPLEPVEECVVRSPEFNSWRIICPIGTCKMGRSHTVKLTEAPREIARVVELQ